MLTNLFIGLPTMMLCLMLQSTLLVSVLRYYAQRLFSVDSARLPISPSF